MQPIAIEPNPLADFIPDKKYFTIGEISHFTGVKAHVLRYWEQVVPMLEPTKRSGRRYYQRQDLLLVMEIDRLLHQEGHTLQGALSKLKIQGLPEGVQLPPKPALRGKKPQISLDKLEAQLKLILRKVQRHNLAVISRWDNLEA
jgi:DNA-binding transcriptional MerR regulator